MAKNELKIRSFYTTFGELIDIAFAESDIELQNFLTQTYQDWCEEKGLEYSESSYDPFKGIFVTVTDDSKTDSYEFRWSKD